MTHIDNVGVKDSVRKFPKNEDITFQKKIKRFSIIIVGGCFLFFISGLLNFTDEYLKGWSTTKPFLGYMLFCFTVLCLVPIAIGFRELVKTSFDGLSQKTARQASWWLLFYAITVFINIIVMGWPLISSFAGLTIVFGRVFGFYYLYKTFMKIKIQSDLNVGGFLYLLYGGFYIITSVIGGIASIVQDDAITNLIFVFDGIIESALIILISIKITYDILNIRIYLIKDKRIGFRILKKKKVIKERKAIHTLKTSVIIDERESPQEKHESYFLTKKSLQRSTKEIKLGKTWFLVILGVILVSLDIYFYLVSNYELALYSLMVTFFLLIYLFSVLFIHLSVKIGLILKANFINFLLLFIIIPTAIVSIFYGILISMFFLPELESNILVFFSLFFGIILQIIVVNSIFKGKLNVENFNFKEYIISCLVLKRRSLEEIEIEQQKKEIQRKKSNPYIIEDISDRIAKRQEARSISIDEFNWKEKIKKYKT